MGGWRVWHVDEGSTGVGMGPTPPAKKPSFDQALKRMLTRAHDGFLALIAPDLAWRGERSPELPVVSRQADLVWEVADRDGVPGILHIELQTQPDAQMGERLAEYAIRLWRRDRLPVRSVVVYLRPTTQVIGSPFVIQWSGLERLRYAFDVVRLWELPQELVLDTPYVDLWPLASLMANITLETTVAVGERIAAAPVPPSERSELAQQLTLLAGLRLSRQAIAAAVRRHPMLNDLIYESSFAQDLIEEGEIKGKADGMRQMAQLALEGRFGTLSDDVLAALTTADEAALRAIVSHLTTDSLEAVRARLGLE